MGFGVWDLGFGVEGLGFGVWGLGFRALASKVVVLCFLGHGMGAGCLGRSREELPLNPKPFGV